MIAEYHLLDTGFCTVNGQIAYGTRGEAQCHAVCALLRHETHGWFLFDTGYAPRVVSAAARFPYSLYKWATPLTIRLEDAVIHQLSRLGLRASDVRTVVVSHFHADHIGGLHDFADARMVCSPEAFADVGNRRGFAALRRAFLPELLPPYFAARVNPVKSVALAWNGGKLLKDMGDISRYKQLFLRKTRGASEKNSDTHRKATLLIGETGELCATVSAICINAGIRPWFFDLFRDGSCFLFPLPGHARGQIGMMARTVTGASLLFVADAAYSARAIRENIPFHPATRLFTDDYAAANRTIAALHAFHCKSPDVSILPTHCPETFARCFR